jgi:hypothetical protein
VPPTSAVSGHLSAIEEPAPRRVGIHQPHYLPWLRYFEKIARSDVFVLLDDVQYEKNGFQNRNKIKTAQGWSYLTVPVKKPLLAPINEILIDNTSGWHEKHLRAVEINYRQAPCFDSYWEALVALYSTPWERLSALNEAMLRWFLEALGIDTPLLRSSELSTTARSTQRLVEICQAVDANVYLSGAPAADAYLDGAAFHTAGITLGLQQWKAPVYPQRFPAAGFVPDLSILDLLLNVGPNSLSLLLGAAGDQSLS